MKNSEINVGGIYAMGGLAPHRPEPWLNPRRGYKLTSSWVPAIALQSPSGNGITALVADFHPLSVQAGLRDQASIEEASKYTADDYAKLEKAIKASREHAFGETPESVVDKVRKERAKLPEGWGVRTFIRPQQLRMVWSDYAVEHQARLQKEDEERAAAEQAYRQRKEHIKALLERAGELGFKKVSSGVNRERVQVSVEEFEQLLDGFQKP